MRSPVLATLPGTRRSPIASQARGAQGINNKLAAGTTVRQHRNITAIIRISFRNERGG